MVWLLKWLTFSIIKNKEQIIEKLQERFTDANIKIIVSCMINNTLVEIEKLEESVLKLVDKRFYKAKLIIDWSFNLLKRIIY